jgi:hypothetical protein
MLEVQPGLTGIVVSRQQLAKNQVKFPSLTPVVECWKGHLVFLCLPSSEPSVPMQEMACQWCSQKVPSTQPDRTQRFFFIFFFCFRFFSGQKKERKEKALKNLASKKPGSSFAIRFCDPLIRFPPSFVRSGDHHRPHRPGIPG